MSALSNIYSDTSDVEESFRAAMQERGLIPPRQLRIGKIGRCPTIEKPRSQNGSYVLYLDGRPAGGMINYSDGSGWQKWKAGGEHAPVSPDVLKARAERRAAERAGDAAAARMRAQRIWGAATNIGADEHPYLKRKGIKAHGARLGRHGLLIVPAYDAQGELQTLQFIAADGTKRFLRGGKKAGASYLVGLSGVHLLIAEGFATACSLAEATGMGCLVAFDAGNLLPVATAIRTVMPGAHLTVCGDDDWKTDGNPGWAHAARAARAVRAELRLPGPWPAGRGDKDTDFNDLARLCGLPAVAGCVNGGHR